jgi:hypothetical protein
MWFNQFLTRRKFYDEVSEEIRQHLAEKAEALMANGMSRDEADRAARREFGNVTQMEERSREPWMYPFIEGLGRDFLYAVRQLGKNPGYALTAILTLALGIAATTAVFSLVDAVLLRPLPFPESDRLMWISQQDHSLPGLASESLSYPDYFDWRAQNHTFNGIASYSGSGVTLQAGGQARRLDAQTVSANFFTVLGAAPTIGRNFDWDEEKPGNRAVMLSYELWKSEFGSSRNIIESSIDLDGHIYRVAGVMPKGFRFPIGNPAPALWKSLAEDGEGKSPKTSMRGFDVLSELGGSDQGQLNNRRRPTSASSLPIFLANIPTTTNNTIRLW